jgi:hypothetical protein
VDAGVAADVGDGIVKCTVNIAIIAAVIVIMIGMMTMMRISSKHFAKFSNVESRKCLENLQEILGLAR